MATFTAGTSFTDGVTGDVTASKLNALVANATPLANLITDRTAETSIADDDLVLISDTSESGALNKMTVANFTNFVSTGTGTAASPAIRPTGDTNTGIFFPAADTIAFSEGGTESMRIDSSGNLLVGTTSGAIHRIVKSSASDFAFQVSNTSSSTPYVQALTFASAAPNDATSMFLRCDDTGQTGRIQLRSNGGLANYSANNVNLSDERLKQDIQASPSYLDKICSIPVVNFKYKDQTHSDYNLGVIAQRVEEVCPELVDVDGFGETPNDGIPLKSIYQTDLQYALMKCIQELKSENDSLKTRIEALEAA